MKQQHLLSVLDALALHWGHRSLGHTTAMRLGSDATNCFVLSHNSRHARDIAGHTRGLTLDDMPWKLKGLRAPLLADHHVMVQLLGAASQEIRRLQHQIDRIHEAMRDTYE